MVATVAHSPWQKKLQDVFGFTTFREGQETVIQHLLEGRSALAVFPTGSGKSLCYQLPALLFEGVTVVVSPLIALMKDQIDFLQRKGIPAARLDSTISGEELREISGQLRQNRLKMLYVAPERFGNERFLRTLKMLDISMLVIDEAHCISEWGHNFRPDYLKLARYASELKVGRVLTLTATATPAVVEDICRAFSIQPEAAVQTGFHRPNLQLHVSGVEGESERIAFLEQRLSELERGPTIVYVTLQHTAEFVAARLASAGYPARAYHAGMKSEERSATQEWFMASENPIVVATIAFGMGIDKADIRYVYHFNLPKSLENYAQEIGRAGRDGANSRCELLVDQHDVVVLENFVYGDTPEESAVRDVLEELIGMEEQFDISIYELSNRHDIRPLVLNTLLTYLELEGVIESTAPFYTIYQFQPLRSSKAILAQFDERRAKFIGDLFRLAEKKKTWFHIDLATAIGKLQVEREKIVSAMNFLEEQGHLTVKVAGVRQGYRFQQRPADVEPLLDTLWPRFRDRESKEIARIRQVLALVREPACLTNHLLTHFTRPLESGCGHCGPCLGEPVTVSETPQLSVELPNWLGAFARQHPELATPRRMARFLCGINSPKLTRSKLTKHDHFGRCRELPFAEVFCELEAREATRRAEGPVEKRA